MCIRDRVGRGAEESWGLTEGVMVSSEEGNSGQASSSEDTEPHSEEEDVRVWGLRVLRAVLGGVRVSEMRCIYRRAVMAWRIQVASALWREIAAEALESEERLLLEVDELSESVRVTEDELVAAVGQLEICKQQLEVQNETVATQQHALTKSTSKVSALKQDIRTQFNALDSAAVRLNTAKRRYVLQIWEHQSLAVQLLQWGSISRHFAFHEWKSHTAHQKLVANIANGTPFLCGSSLPKGPTTIPKERDPDPISNERLAPRPQQSQIFEHPCSPELL
eukprot:TRINITY_DN60823_c0_g2_i1.p1 TRINITY_DN60823_c0_g2~~TRINITY_DN60823_c0_g2_i1.p1  ORF type:complete len:278 (-),score=72.82 TRINITY_DN60823_c0_g2_i1:361-1194(-)